MSLEYQSVDEHSGIIGVPPFAQCKVVIEILNLTRFSSKVILL
jgi:hypothetical protein